MVYRVLSAGTLHNEFQLFARQVFDQIDSFTQPFGLLVSLTNINHHHGGAELLPGFDVDIAIAFAETEFADPSITRCGDGPLVRPPMSLCEMIGNFSSSKLRL
jgi:hypothetical protein